jgi:hypothetical protein
MVRDWIDLKSVRLCGSLIEWFSVVHVVSVFIYSLSPVVVVTVDNNIKTLPPVLRTERTFSCKTRCISQEWRTEFLPGYDSQ